MADREKVINHFQDAIEASNNNNKWRFVRVDVIEDAIELLKEQESKVLTTDELFHMEHQGVYIERRNSQLYATEPAIVLRTEVCAPSFGGKKYVLIRENKLSDPHWACDYNKAINDGWRCWTAKPTDEQRKAVKWDD